MSIITRIVKSVKSAPVPTVPSVPDDDAFESWSPSADQFEPSAEDWAALRRFDAPGELDLEAYLGEQASYYRSTDTERGIDLAAYLDRAAQLAALCGARSLVDLADRMEAWDKDLREREYERGRRDGELGSLSLR